MKITVMSLLLAFGLVSVNAQARKHPHAKKHAKSAHHASKAKKAKGIAVGEPNPAMPSDAPAEGSMPPLDSAEGK